MEDKRIIDLLFERNELALDAARQKYGGMCQSIARRLLTLTEDAEECAKAIQYLLEHKAEADQMGLAASAFIREHYAWETCFKAFEALGFSRAATEVSP